MAIGSEESIFEGPSVLSRGSFGTKSDERDVRRTLLRYFADLGLVPSFFPFFAGIFLAHFSSSLVFAFTTKKGGFLFYVTVQKRLVS